uniref:Uncharacterized protein n=1 Tax=Meloidogyne enterolobii TaxID=390850 RepID=A0A6V7X3Z0_MELEN|nr:unnamed protein product [Meloidogyne enterolobii]
MRTESQLSPTVKNSLMIINNSFCDSCCCFSILVGQVFSINE